MLVAALVVFLAVVIAIAYFQRKRAKFNAEATARMRAKSRQKWSKWLDDGPPDKQHDETWVEYQERKRR